MKVEICIVPETEETTVVIRTPGTTELAEELANYIRAWTPLALTLRQGNTVVRCSPAEILHFFAENKGVSARRSDGQVFSVDCRLYELEELLDPHTFVRISHSEIVNLKQVTALDLSLSGTIKMTLANGAAVCYASRRYVKKIKQALGL